MPEPDITDPRNAVFHSTARRAPAAPDLDERLAALPAMSLAKLQSEWRRLYRAQPPSKLSRDLLELAVAWKLQEKILGGLAPAAKRQLAGLTQMMESRGDLSEARAVTIKPGTRLAREWHGETHDVLVLENGYRWRGEHWRSLSAIAREITGSRWSGPRFFGLSRAEKAEPDEAVPTALRLASKELADA